MSARTAAHQAPLSSPVPQSLLKFTSTASGMLTNHLILWCPFLLLSLTFPTIGVFPNGVALCSRWPKYWSFSFSISLFSECSGLIFFRTDWFHLHIVQGTFKSLLQHQNSNASILKHLAFFMVQLSHLYMATGRTVALTTWTLVTK